MNYSIDFAFTGRSPVLCFSRVVSFLALSIVASLQLSADDQPGEEIDGTKLIGQWERGIKDNKYLIEFTLDGFVKIQHAKISTTTTNKARYILQGSKLTYITTLSPEKEEKIVMIITKLTDSELEYRYSGELIESFRRVKPKKK